MTDTVTTVQGQRFNSGTVTNGRRSGGFSLRRALENQGVTSEKAMRGHLRHVLSVLRMVPGADITRYRVDTNNPNKVPTHVRIAR